MPICSPAVCHAGGDDLHECSNSKKKRDISALVNRVAYGGEYLPTSRGKPKAVLVSVEDYACLQAEENQSEMAQWQARLRKTESLS